NRSGSPELRPPACDHSLRFALRHGDSTSPSTTDLADENSTRRPPGGIALSVGKGSRAALAPLEWRCSSAPLMRIRDPIHGTIPVADVEVPIVDSRFYQRLRSVKQLGFGEMAFPGAPHTRHAHSLGAMHVATRLFDA